MKKFISIFLTMVIVTGTSSAVCAEGNYDIKKIQQAADVLNNTDNVDNPVGFMIKAIDEKYCINDLVQLMTYTNYNQLIINTDEIIFLNSLSVAKVN